MIRPRILPLLASATVFLTSLPQMQLPVSAEDATLNISLTPPQALSVYDPAYLLHNENSALYLNFTNSLSYLEFCDAWEYPDEDSVFRNQCLQIQIDFKLDDGDWHYSTAWDSNPYGDYDNYADGFDTDYGFNFNCYDDKLTFEGYLVAEYLRDDLDIIEKDVASAFKKYTDGEDDYYVFDTENHQLAFRARYYVEMLEYESDEITTFTSDWSEECVYGKGEGVETDIYPASGENMLPAPLLTAAAVTEIHGYADAPTVQLTIQPNTELAPLLYSNFDPHNSPSHMVIEMSPNGTDWYARDNSSTSMYHFKEDFYDYWDMIEGNDDTFSWATATVQFRAKYSMNVYGEDSAGNYVDYYLESPYSEPVTVEIPGMESYEIKITHTGSGWNGGGTQTRRFVEDAEIGWIAPDCKEGCYVQSVTVNGRTLFERGVEATYDWLQWEWYSSQDTIDIDNLKDFRLRDDANIVTQDLDIVITYGGEATKIYKVSFTQHGPFGSKYEAYGINMSNQIGWENHNTILLYNGTESTLVLSPVNLCEVKQLFVDTVDVTDQLVFDPEFALYSYDFGTIEKDYDVVVFYERHGAGWEYTYSGGGFISPVDYTNQQSTMGLVAGDALNFDVIPYQILTDTEGNPLEDTWTKLLSLTVSMRIGNAAEKTIVEQYSKTVNADAYAEIVQNQKYTFVVPEDSNVNATYYVEAEFSNIDDPIIKYHDITVTRGEGASDAANEVIQAEEHQNTGILLTPASGYELDTVIVDGEVIENFGGTIYFFTDVTEAHTISATYKKIEDTESFKVTVTVNQPQNSNNVVTPIGDSLVESNGTFMLTLKPAENCRTASVTVNGEPLELFTDKELEVYIPIYQDTEIVVTLETIMVNVTFVDWNGNELYKTTVPYGSTCLYAGDTNPISLNGWNDKNEYMRFVEWSHENSQIFTADTIVTAVEEILAFTVVPPSRVTYDTKNGNVDTTDIELQVSKTLVKYTPEYDENGTLVQYKKNESTENAKYHNGEHILISPTTLEQAFQSADTCDVKVFYSFTGMPDIEVGSFQIAYAKGFQLGDVDRDGLISERDAIAVLKEYASVAVMGGSSILDDQQIPLADINSDGNIDTMDAILILRYYTNYSILGKTDITWEEILKK